MFIRSPAIPDSMSNSLWGIEGLKQEILKLGVLKLTFSVTSVNINKMHTTVIFYKSFPVNNTVRGTIQYKVKPNAITSLSIYIFSPFRFSLFFFSQHNLSLLYTSKLVAVLKIWVLSNIIKLKGERTNDATKK